jgi:p-aminobenzoyl-glutamate transporter AbgT
MCIGGSVVMAVMVVVMVVGWWVMQRVVERHRSILSRSKRTNKAISIVDRTY